MRIHILGICGTFMAGIAVLAKQMGHQVSGSDEQVYPPMSDQLAQQGIDISEGYLPEHLDGAELIIVGNAMRRGYPIVEYVLNRGLKYISGPQWLADNVLSDRWVLAVSGTHGKTTTTSMLAWMLEEAGLKPGYLIGGVANNFPSSVKLGEHPFFVIEADEYDSAFFDKRSKFIHYHPRTLVINNLEFDHADIFDDLAAIQKQFHHLLRTVPGCGAVIYNHDDSNISDTLALGCWSEQQGFSLQNAEWGAIDLADDGTQFSVTHKDKIVAKVSWQMLGKHNVYNALAAIAAAHHAGITIETATTALASFKGIKRRMEVRGTVNDITVYDDFAHHPTAIKNSVDSLRHHVGKKRIIAILELASYTMRSGVHGQQLFSALSNADHVFLLQPKDVAINVPKAFQSQITCVDNVDLIVQQASQQAEPGDQLLVMSNRGFAGIHERLLEQLQA